METLQDEYQALYEKRLTLKRLGEVISVLRIPDMSNGLHPTPDAGKRRAQLVADRRDEFILQTLGFGQLPRHLVDGIAQPANLVTVAAFGQTALRSPRAMALAVWATSSSGRTMERMKNTPLHTLNSRIAAPMPSASSTRSTII